MAVAAVGLVAWIAGVAAFPRQALHSYLAAYAYVTSIALGSLVLVMSFHAAKAQWPVVVRRLVEDAVATLPWCAVLFLPLAIGAGKLYPWAGAVPLTGRLYEVVTHQRPYLNVPFFVARTVLYFAVWIGLAEALRRWSLRQDADADPSWSFRQWRASGVGLVAVALTWTFASFDWLMSLTPEWKSSIYGVYVFAGGFLCAFSLGVLLMLAAVRTGVLARQLSSSHFYAMGKFTLAFTIFWGYVAFAQYFIQWIAGIPSETSFWIPRSRGWAHASVALAIGHFAAPFLALLSRGLKHRPRPLAVVCGWLLLMHYFDMYWLVLPSLHEDGPAVHWLDFAALVFVVGSTAAFALWRARGHSLIPVGEPRLAASIAYEAS